MAEKIPDKAPGAFSLLGTASTMGLHMVSGPIVGGGLGWLIDQGLDSWPVASAIGILLGLVAGFRNVWADARYLERSNAARDAEKKKQAESVQRIAETGRKQASNGQNEPVIPVFHKGGAPHAGDASAVDIAGRSVPAATAEDAFTASVFAGTAVSAEHGLEELDETLEAIRKVLAEDDSENSLRDGAPARKKEEV